MLNHIIAMLGIMTILTALIHILAVAWSKFDLDREAVRKTLHVVMGTITLSFPWIFHETWPVVALSIISSLFLAAIKISSQNKWRTVVLAPGRKSVGEVCFPIAVGLTFVLADGDPFLFVAPIAVLTYADAVSAIIGMRFGRRKFSTLDGQKSSEGSLAFLVTAFTTTLVLALLPGTGAMLMPAEAIVLALIVSVIAMLFEGISWMGLDNLLIPLGAYYAIITHEHLPLPAMYLSLTALALLALGFVLLRNRSTLTGSAVMAVALFSYFAFHTGGPLFVLSPAALFLSYKYLMPKRFRDLKNLHSLYGVLTIAAAGTFWILLARGDSAMASSPQASFYLFPYSLTFGAHAAIIATAHLRYQKLDRYRLKVLAAAVGKAWCLTCMTCLPYMAFLQNPEMILLYLFLAPVAIALPTLMFYLLNANRLAGTTRPARWLKQASFASLGSVLGLLPLLI